MTCDYCGQPAGCETPCHACAVDAGPPPAQRYVTPDERLANVSLYRDKRPGDDIAFANPAWAKSMGINYGDMVGHYQPLRVVFDVNCPSGHLYPFAYADALEREAKPYALPIEPASGMALL